MQSDSSILSALNAVLTTELTSINRYFLHARMHKNWGFDELNSACFKKSIKDMKQSDTLIERILFLEGLPNLQQLLPLMIGEHTEEMITCDMKFQIEQVKQIKDTIALCEQHKDFVSREILNEILEYEEGFVDWLEIQQYQMTNVGMQNYLQSKV